jgi:hypothetical protein
MTREKNGNDNVMVMEWKRMKWNKIPKKLTNHTTPHHTHRKRKKQKTENPEPEPELRPAREHHGRIT